MAHWRAALVCAWLATVGSCVAADASSAGLPDVAVPLFLLLPSCGGVRHEQVALSRARSTLRSFKAAAAAVAHVNTRNCSVLGLGCDGFLRAAASTSEETARRHFTVSCLSETSPMLEALSCRRASPALALGLEFADQFSRGTALHRAGSGTQ